MLAQAPPEREWQMEEMPRELVEFHSLETFQGICGVSVSGDIPNPLVCVPVSPAPGHLWWSGGWTRWSPEIPSNPNDSVIL